MIQIGLVPYFIRQFWYISRAVDFSIHLLFQSQSSLMDLAILFFQNLGAFFFIYLACEFGEQVRNAYDGIECEMSQLGWYRLPMEVQKILPTVMVFAQEPVVLRGLGSVVCSREVFQKVSKVRKGFSKHTLVIIFRYFSDFQWWIFLLRNAPSIHLNNKMV